MKFLIIGNSPSLSHSIFFHLTNSLSFNSSAQSSIRFGDCCIVDFEVVVGMDLGVGCGSVWGLEALQVDGIIYAVEYIQWGWCLHETVLIIYIYIYIYILL